MTVSLVAILLSLGCGIGFAASDYFRKTASISCSTALVLFYFMGGQIPILAAWLAFTQEARLTPAYILPGLVDIALGLAANVCFIAAVRRSPLSLMIPLLALVPVITAGTGALLLREMLSLGQLSGTVLIVVGLFALYTPPKQSAAAITTWRAIRTEPGVPLMLCTVIGWSLTPVFDKMCVNASSVPVHGLIQVIAICALSGLWIVMKNGPAALIPPHGSRVALAGGAISAGFGYGLQLAAYQATMVAVVEGLKRVTGLLAALVVGRVMFAEPITTPKIIGVAILAVGVPLILMG